MTLRIVTPPAVEPATTAEVKTDARIDSSSLDATIAVLITAARKVAEDRTGRALITQTWELVLDAFPAAEIEIGLMPIQSITWVKYYDSDGALQTLGSDQYVLDVDTMPGWLLPAYGVSWPSTYAVANAVIIRFVAGYGAAASNVPAELRMWIRAQAAAAIDHQDGLMDGKSIPLPFIDGLLDSYRLRWI